MNQLNNFYETRKQNLIFMITHYEKNCELYLKLIHLSLDDIHELWDYDRCMADKYIQDLLLLEAQHILNLI